MAHRSAAKHCWVTIRRHFQVSHDRREARVGFAVDDDAGSAFRVVYAVQIGAELWVVHAFQKKSTQGIKTPRHEIDLIMTRVKRLKEMLR